MSVRSFDSVAVFLAGAFLAGAFLAGAVLAAGLILWASADDDQMEGLGPANPSPLESAAMRADVQRVEDLLAEGADPDAGIYSSPLMTAVDDEDPSPRRAEVVVALLDHGADIDHGGMSGSDQTPLQRAAMWNSPDLVELLLSRGADPCSRVFSPPNMRGMTALDMARDRGSTEAEAILEDPTAGCE